MLLLLGLQPHPLSSSHRIWLEEEVHFLITSAERERFLAFAVEGDRERFIEAFWIGRDRVEHAERLRSSDRLFGARGRFSGRGRIYQLLGPPTFREDLTRAGHRLVPTELWHYTGVSTSFLPDSFYLIFFRPGGSARYRLWSPTADGVSALVATAEPGRFLLESSPDEPQEIGAPNEIARIDPELARAVLELVPGGGPLRSESLLANLEAFADLAERDRSFSDRVRAGVSVRPLPAHLAATVLRDDALVPELHYALELEAHENRRLPWRRVGEGQARRWRTRFTLVGRLVGAEDDADELERWQDTLELDVSDPERELLSDIPLSFQGRRFVPPEAERFEAVLVSEDGAAAVLESGIDTAELAPLLLARGWNDVTDARPRLPFLVRNTLLSPRPSLVVEENTVFAVTQLLAREATKLRWEVWRDGELESTEERALDAPGATMMTKAIALDTTPARYRVRVTHGQSTREVRFRTEPGRESASIRVVAREPTPAEESLYRLVRVQAFARRGMLERAIQDMETVVEQRADDVRAHLDLARLLYRSRRYTEVMDRLGAVVTQFENEVDVFVLMAASAEALDWNEQAVAYYEKAMALAPDNVEIQVAHQRARARLP